MLDDLGGGVGLPLPDVASPHWLGGMGPSNSDPGAAAGMDGRLGVCPYMWQPLQSWGMLDASACMALVGLESWEPSDFGLG